MDRIMERLRSLARLLPITQPRLLILEGWRKVVMGSRAKGVGQLRRALKSALKLRMPVEEELAKERVEERAAAGGAGSWKNRQWRRRIRSVFCATSISRSTSTR